MVSDTKAPQENAAKKEPQSNPLSRKINKILETRLENDKVRLEPSQITQSFYKLSGKRLITS